MKIMTSSKGQRLADTLLHPATFKIRRGLRAFHTLPQETALTMAWPTETQRRIEAWVKTGDLQVLAELLRASPRAIAHPIVFWQIWHLVEVSRKLDEGDVRKLREWGAGASVDPEEVVNPKGARSMARSALKELMAAWLGGLIPWCTLELKRPSRRRGRPAKWDEMVRLDLLGEYSELRIKLEDVELPLDPGKSRPRQVGQVALVIQDLHRESWRSVETYRVAEEPEYDAQGKLNLRAWRMRRGDLPAGVAKAIAERAMRKRSVAKDRLVYGLLAYYETGHVENAEGIRGIIERAEEKWPHLSYRSRR
jgi:hypothetical protein